MSAPVDTLTPIGVKCGEISLQFLLVDSDVDRFLSVLLKLGSKLRAKRADQIKHYLESRGNVAL